MGWFRRRCVDLFTIIAAASTLPGCEREQDTTAADLRADLAFESTADPDLGVLSDPDLGVLSQDASSALRFEGIRENTPDALLLGWTPCYRFSYADEGEVEDMLRLCDGQWVMAGCREIGAERWQLLAMGRRAAIFEPTGPGNDALTDENGVSWYFDADFSFGFLPLGSEAFREKCDTVEAEGALRMCWHARDGVFRSGYRCGEALLNEDADWERAVWTAN